MNRARANELELRDASLCQEPVRLLGDVYMLAVCNMLRLLSSQANCFFAKKEKGDEEVGFTVY